MHRLVPELILENHRLGQQQGTLKAAGMFLDISGFSAMTDALMGQGREGAETLAVIMRRVFDPLVEAIFAQGGVIVGFAGDSITALFEVEADEAEAARRALAAAHRIQQRRGEDPAFETPFGMFNVSVKVGLSLGEAAWGILPSRNRDKAIHYFRGEALEEAARAEQQAVAGDILLTAKLKERLGREIETRPLKTFHVLAGIVGPMPAPRSIELPEVDAAAAAVFVPREMVTQDLQGEFRQTVHVFMRLPDLPDEQLREFMFAFFDQQRRYGGFLDRIDFGDKGCTLVAVWGAPVAHENDIDRGLSFVLDLQRYVKFPLTTGVTYYTSYAGYMGGALYETYTAYGWGISLAARLMMGAPDGATWLDERIFQRAKARFDFDSVGQKSFKGFARKQEVYVLRGRKSRTEMLFRGKWAGREVELQRLAEFVSPIWDGKEAGVLGIWGDAGIGKSRLVHEFRRSHVFRGRNCTWGSCQADEILHRSFHPLRHWLSQHFEILPEQDEAARARKFRRKLDELIAATASATLADELGRARPFLAALLDLEMPDAFYQQLDGQARYDHTILALISLLKAESLRQPLILLFEDVQYLDADTRLFIPRLKRSLAAEARSYPMAILMTGRWQGQEVLLEEGLVDQQLTLEGLPDESIAVLSGDLLGQPAAASLTRLVNERAGGNPFFAEQILRFLLEQELLETNQAGEWTLEAEATSSALPTDVRAMLVARLDRLRRQVKDAIHAASVLGRVFEVTVLSRMLADRLSLPHEIAAAEQAAVWSPLSEIRYIFNHALLRDVAYSMQLQSRRQELHAVAFDALTEVCAPEIQRHYPELAYHAEHAGRPAEARHYLALAGDAARDQYQNAQALDFYRRALALVPATEAAEQFRLHRECEKLVTEQGKADERRGEVDALQALAEAMGDAGSLAEVMMLRSQLLVSSGEYEKAAELAARARQMALEASRHDIAVGTALALLDAYWHRGLYREAIEHGEAGLELARKHKRRREEAYLLNRLGLAFNEMKNPSTARSYVEQSLAIFRAEDDLRGVARVLPNLGLVAAYQGNYTAAIDYYEQSLRMAREIGSRKLESICLGNLGWVCGLMGDHKKALAYVERNVQIAREIGDRYIETISLLNLSSQASALGDHALAIDSAEQALALARQSDDRGSQAWALTYLGHGLIESGSLEAARQAYQDGLDLRYQLDQPLLATEPAAGLALASMLQNDRAAAKEHVERILVQLEQDGTLEGTDQTLRVYLSCHLVLRGLKDARARGILKTAHEMLKTRANGIADPSARQTFLEEVTYNKQILALWEKRG